MGAGSAPAGGDGWTRASAENPQHTRGGDPVQGSVAGAAILKIKELVANGSFWPGQKLPSEARLAAQLGLSRSSLREAVRALSLLGVLSVRQGDGTYVTSLEPNVLLGSTGFAMDLLAAGSPVDVFGVRQLLEPSVTAIAAARLTHTDLARLRDTIDNMERLDDLESQAVADLAFHGIVADSVGNAALAALLASMSGLTLRIWTQSAGDKGAQLTRSLVDHRAILDALVARDPERARAAATVHLVNAEEWFVRAVQKP